MNKKFERNCVAAILLKIQAIYSLWLSLKIDKIAITHLAMEIHFQTTDHVVAEEKLAEQHIATKYSKCNSLRVISHIIILGKSAITHSKVGQSSPNPQNIEERKNSLAQVIYQKRVTVIVSEKTACPTHAHTYTHTWCKLSAGGR